MNYYIQGNKEKADKIKAAFEELGINVLGFGFADKAVVYCSIGECVQYLPYSINLMNILYSHPDYQELPLHVKSNPKFKVGDWIVRSNGSSDIPIQVYGIKSGRYLVTNMLGSKGELMINRQDEWHLWTINDARPGDILNANGAVFIYKRHNKDYVYHYCGINLGNEFVIGTDDSIWNANNEIYPATQEQKDLLFKRIKETGYIWDLNSNTLTNKTKFKIGDWVMCNHYQDMPFTKQFRVDDFAKGEYVFCEPIPLTEEILVKNGFRYTANVIGRHNCKCYELEQKGVYHMTISIYKNTITCELDKVDALYMNVVTNYVHELQHLLRLCGVEKEIEL